MVYLFRGVLLSQVNGKGTGKEAKKRRCSHTVILFVLLFWGFGLHAQQPDFTVFVNPFIGTENGGNVFVGAARPFGMVKLGPDCGNNDNNSGYYKDRPVNGFSHTHVSGTGGGAKYGNILLMPIAGPLDLTDVKSERIAETAGAGFYAATLHKGNIAVELTATHSVGLHRYTFQPGTDQHVVVDAGHFLDFGRDWGENQHFVGSELKVLSNRAVEGYSRIRGGWNKGGAYTVYFYAEFDRPAVQSGTWKGVGKKQTPAKEQPDTGEKTGAWFSFGHNRGHTVQAKVGLSFVSTGKAKWNVEQETAHWNFAAYRQAAEREWKEKLSLVQVEGGAPHLDTMLYTALYHSLLMPSNRTGENPKWQSAEPYYDDFYAVWDTYRTTSPLLTLIQPGVQRYIIRSMLDIYRHEGYMPDARSGNDNGRTQGGSNSDIVIADAYVKNLGGIDYHTALAAMIKNAEVPPGGNEQKEGRGGIPDYNTLGYVSTDYERAGTRTVEYAANDYAIATVAKGLGKTDLYRKYLKRSHNWKNLWRPVEAFGAKGFIWPRKKDGSWQEDYHTLQPGSWNDFFYESQSWELSLYVPHDVAGLITNSGGAEAFAQRLDTFFIRSKPNVHGWMDFYNVNNEPGFLTPLLYHWINKPEKSAAQIRQIIRRHFGAGRNGLPGNDDAGALSSWLLFHLLGFYPNAGQDVYLIAAPHFVKSSLQLPNGKRFTVEAVNLNEQNQFIQSATLDGKEWKQSWFRHADIKNGGTLRLLMGSTSSGWGSENQPPSLSDNGELIMPR